MLGGPAASRRRLPHRRHLHHRPQRSDRLSLSNARVAEHVAGGHSSSASSAASGRTAAITLTPSSPAPAAPTTPRSASSATTWKQTPSSTSQPRAAIRSASARPTRQDYYLEQTFTISVVAEANTVAIGDLVWNDTQRQRPARQRRAGSRRHRGRTLLLAQRHRRRRRRLFARPKVTDSNGKYHFDHLLPHADGARSDYYLVSALRRATPSRRRTSAPTTRSTAM